MLERRAADVTLPDLAREAGVATATVYRHFDDAADLRSEFYHRYVSSLVEEMETVPAGQDAGERVSGICRAWIAGSARWARAATYIRSAEGYLERLHAGDDFIGRLNRGVLEPALRAAMEQGLIPEQDLQYAALVWVTLFDERVIVDLTSGLGWSADEVAAHLEQTLLGALGAARS